MKVNPSSDLFVFVSVGGLLWVYCRDVRFRGVSIYYLIHQPN